MPSVVALPDMLTSSHCLKADLICLFTFHPIHAHVSSSLSVVLFLLTFYFLLYYTFPLFLFMANSSDSMNLNTLCHFANGTFVTLDDCLPDTDTEPSPVVLGEQATMEKNTQRLQKIASTLSDLNAEGLNVQTVNDLLSMYVGAASQHALRLSFVPEQEAQNFDRQVLTFWSRSPNFNPPSPNK